MKPQKIQFAYNTPIWISFKEMNVLLGCKRTKSLETINTIKELIKDKYPIVYQVKGKILFEHFIEHNDFPVSEEDVIKSLKEGISLLDISIMKIKSNQPQTPKP